MPLKLENIHIIQTSHVYFLTGTLPATYDGKVLCDVSNKKYDWMS